jgi:two-component system, OmpR family, phosphate regulon response regulator PhoB
LDRGQEPEVDERTIGDGRLAVRPDRRPLVLAIGAGQHRQATLEAAGYRVRLRDWHEADQLPPDVDLVLTVPGEGEPAAAAVVRGLRSRFDGPVMALLDGSDETERVRALEAGADDCVDGIGDGELLARIAALLRRASLPWPSRLVVDEDAREATLDGQRLDLTRREFDLLARLAATPRRVWTRAQLLEQVWPRDVERQGTATVTEHVRRLRDKLVAAGGSRECIETVRGVGYRLVPERCGTTGDDADRDRRQHHRRQADRDAPLVVLPDLSTTR